MSGPADPTWQNFDLGHALTQAAQPISNLGAGQVNLALSNLSRRRQLEDIGASRQFETQFQQQSSKIRMKEDTERARVALIQKFSELGVPGLNYDSTPDEANSKYRSFLQNRAKNTLDMYKGQISSAEKKQGDALSAINNVISNGSQETLAQRREFLSQVLNDPSAAKLTDRMKLELTQSLVSGDPKDAMAKVLSEMQDYWGSGSAGGHIFSVKSGRMSDANDFLQAYLSKLQPAVSLANQQKLSIANEVLGQTMKEHEDLMHQASAHVMQNSGVLDNGDVKDWISRSGGSVNPADALAAHGIGNADYGNEAGSGSDKVPGGQPPPAPPAPTPAPPASPIPTPDARTFTPAGVGAPSLATLAPPSPTRSSMVAAGGSIGPIALPGDTGEGLANYFQGLKEVAQSAWSLGQTDPYGGASRAPSPGEIAAYAIRRDLSLDPNPKPTPANEAEIQAALKLNESTYGAPQGSPQLKQLVAAGDPRGISGLNFLLKQVRTRSASGAPIDPSGPPPNPVPVQDAPPPPMVGAEVQQ